MTGSWAFKLSPKWKNTTVSTSMMDNRWTWDQYETVTLIGCFQTSDQNLSSVRKQLVGEKFSMRDVSSILLSLISWWDREGDDKKSPRNKKGKMILWNGGRFVILHQRIRIKMVMRKRHTSERTGQREEATEEEKK